MKPKKIVDDVSPGGLFDYSPAPVIMEAKKVANEIEKPKGLFDHLPCIMVSKDPDYFSNLTEKERRDYSPFIIQRFLSMIPEYAKLINHVNKYVFTLDKEEYHKLMMVLIPKKKMYINWIKKSGKEDKVDRWMIDCLVKMFEVSERDATNYIELLTESAVKSLGRQFGIEEKVIKKTVKYLNK